MTQPTDEDRAAAAELIVSDYIRDTVLAGLRDDHFFVQAFAAHRLAAIAAATPDLLARGERRGIERAAAVADEYDDGRASVAIARRIRNLARQPTIKQT